MRKGLASGVIVSGMGIGAFIFGLVTQDIVNPDNAQPVPVEVADGVYENYFSPEVNAHVPRMFTVLCIIWSCQVTFALLTVSTFTKEPEYN